MDLIGALPSFPVLSLDCSSLNWSICTQHGLISIRDLFLFMPFNTMVVTRFVSLYQQYVYPWSYCPHPAFPIRTARRDMTSRLRQASWLARVHRRVSTAGSWFVSTLSAHANNRDHEKRKKISITENFDKFTAFTRKFRQVYTLQHLRQSGNLYTPQGFKTFVKNVINLVLMLRALVFAWFH